MLAFNPVRVHGLLVVGLPVRNAFVTAFYIGHTELDNQRDVAVPQHLHEVGHRSGFRSLAGNKSSAPRPHCRVNMASRLIRLKLYFFVIVGKIAMFVIVGRHSLDVRVLLKTHTRMVVR